MVNSESILHFEQSTINHNHWHSNSHSYSSLTWSHLICLNSRCDEFKVYFPPLRELRSFWRTPNKSLLKTVEIWCDGAKVPKHQDLNGLHHNV